MVLQVQMVLHVQILSQTQTVPVIVLVLWTDDFPPFWMEPTVIVLQTQMDPAGRG